MSLIFSGPGGSTERRWITYALLRDNLQHHLEDGEPGSKFPTIHALADALSSVKATVSSNDLREEIERAQALCARPASDLALSARTVAVISHRWPMPDDVATRPASEWGIDLPMAHGAETLGDVFGGFLEDLQRIVGTEGDAPVEVIDN